MEKIPHNKLPQSYENYNYIDSPLVEITNDSGIIIDLQYPKLNFKNAINTCLVRKEILDKLLEAKSYLPENLTFKVLDAYRTFSLQEELYYAYREQILKEFNLLDKDKETQDNFIKNYVSLPKKEENLVPLHATGGAIDLSLVNIQTGEDLDMGIEFDSFSDLTNTDSFEKENMDKTIRDNRRILYWAMTKAGFTNLPTECWHFDYGNRNWAFYNQKPIIYKAIFEL